MDRSQIEIAGPIDEKVYNAYAQAQGYRATSVLETTMLAFITEPLRFSDFRALAEYIVPDLRKLANVHPEGNFEYSRFRKELQSAKAAAEEGKSIDDYITLLELCANKIGNLRVTYRISKKTESFCFNRASDGSVYLSRLISHPYLILSQGYAVSLSVPSNELKRKQAVLAIAKID